MDDLKLLDLVRDLSTAHFNKPFLDKAIFNKRLRTTGGRYLPYKRLIEINPKYLKELGYKELIGIIKHELCHYHLHIIRKPYGHGSSDFKRLLKETNSPRHCQRLPSERNKQINWYTYECNQCRQKYKRKRKVNVNKYNCGRCKGEIEYVQ